LAVNVVSSPGEGPTFPLKNRQKKQKGNEKESRLKKKGPTHRKSYDTYWKNKKQTNLWEGTDRRGGTFSRRATV